MELTQKIEEENHFPTAHYAFDSGVLFLDLAKYIESCGKHWVCEIEKNRNIMWDSKYQRVDQVAVKLSEESPASFRNVKIKHANGEDKKYWAFTKAVRLKKYGNKRLVIAFEKEDLSDEPRFFLSSAKHWEKKRILETWTYRWSVEVYHEFAKQNTGLESAQVRNEESVKKHLALSLVSQSLIQRVSCEASKIEKYDFAEGKITFGQKCRAVTREVLKSILVLAEKQFRKNISPDHFLETIMPI